MRLSDKHGVNPAVEQCFYCMKDVGVILFGKLKDDAEAPRQISFGPGSEPCDECKGWMDKGVILISVDESKTTDPDNPWRSGRWVVTTEEFIQRTIASPKLVDQILKTRVCFIPDKVWNALGLPRGEEEEEEKHNEATMQDHLFGVFNNNCIQKNDEETQDHEDYTDLDGVISALMFWKNNGDPTEIGAENDEHLIGCCIATLATLMPSLRGPGDLCENICSRMWRHLSDMKREVE